MNRCFSCPKGFKDCGNKLGEDTEDRGIQMIEIVEADPATCGGHAAEDVLEPAIIHRLGAVELVQ